jgi:hypothetical protein
MLAVNTPPQSLVLKIADRAREAGAAHEVKVKYKAKVTYKAEQVRVYLGFLKSLGLTITNRNISEPFLTLVNFPTHVQVTTHGSFST